ncbi:TPA: PfkB family carbohydrate kinase [Klebsiella pneumoniae]
MLVDHVHQIGQWPERGWLVEIVHSERATGGAPLNVLLTLAKMHAGLPLQAVGLIGEDNDGDYITAMLDQYHINRQLVQRTSSAPTSMTQVRLARITMATTSPPCSISTISIASSYSAPAPPPPR